MGVRVSEEIVEKIRRAVDIVDIIGEYIPLKKQGRNFFGLCPFHGEKTPSFSVSPDKQLFHCFGCKVGGNVFSFLMEIEGCSFLEAVYRLGEKAGIELPEYDNHTTVSNKLNGQHEIKEMHELLSKLYQFCLLKTNQGKKALDYLRNRGFDEKTIRTFQVGFSPDSWEFATNFLAKRGYSLSQAEKAGLLSRRPFDGKYFDRFRNRIMFPIQNMKGETIAFGGRVISEAEPKYLNSPETVVFNKGKTLYGFHLARSTIRLKRQAILFEGYVDVISTWKSGVKNGIATLGTSLTEEQAGMIRRSAESVVICYDSDDAGVNAALRAADLLEKAGCYVKIAKMPDGLDPDDYIQSYGGERFEKDVIGQASTVMSFKIDVLRKGKNLQDEGERIRFVEKVLQEISQLPKAVERDHYLRQLADEFSLSLEALKQQQFQYYIKAKKKQDNRVHQGDANAGKSLVSKRLLPAYQNAERMLLAHMMKDRIIAKKVQDEIGGGFHVEEHNALAAHLYAFYGKGRSPDVGAFMQTIEDQALVKMAAELAMADINDNISEEELSDYIHVIHNYSKWLEIKEKEKEKIEAERKEDFLSAAKIAKHILELKKALKSY